MKHTFEIGERDFLLDGKAVVLRCGEMHYPRIPRPYWRHRLRMLKAMGCNMVATYDFWNLHEPAPGKWDFSGIADIVTFLKTAQEEGLWVMLRPGPYVCAEWELGGIPWWLLKIADIALRTQDPRYLAAVEKYVARLAREVRPMLVTNGGPVLMVQVENEYGSYGKDKEYVLAVKKMWQRGGIDVPLFTADGPSQLWNGSRTDTFSGVNGGVGSLDELRRFRPTGPLIITEYYPGWLSHWGEPFPRVGTAGVVRDVTTMLGRGVSFNFYMAHGGTNFALWAGANFPRFAPDTTSYDYNAPIDEAGRATEKYHAIRAAIAGATGESLPPVPPPVPSIAIPKVSFAESAPLFEHLPKGIDDARPRPMEQYDCGLGAILYRTTLPAGGEASLTLSGANDWTQVFVAGKRIAVLDRRRGENSATVPPRTEPQRLDILVEAMGRINYGSGLHDRKGLTGDALLAGKPIAGSWKVFPLPLEDLPKGLRFARTERSGGPAFHRATFSVSRPGDTYLDMRNWHKGMVWVNGHPLGRYWNLGPQQTLYCPGCWLKNGANEIVVLEWDAPREATVAGRKEPILNELHPEALSAQPHRKPGQTLSLVSLVTAWEGELASGNTLQKVTLSAPVTGRYLCLEAVSDHAGDDFATLAELTVLDGAGKPMRGKLLYADSEETASDDGNADHVLDGDSRTFWHTQWSSGATSHPHQLVLDLRQEVTISGVTLLPRQDSPNERIKRLRLYVRRDPFPGL